MCVDNSLRHRSSSRSRTTKRQVVRKFKIYSFIRTICLLISRLFSSFFYSQERERQYAYSLGSNLFNNISSVVTDFCLFKPNSRLGEFSIDKNDRKKSQFIVVVDICESEEKKILFFFAGDFKRNFLFIKDKMQQQQKLTTSGNYIM